MSRNFYYVFLKKGSTLDEISTLKCQRKTTINYSSTSHTITRFSQPGRASINSSLSQTTLYHSTCMKNVGRFIPVRCPLLFPYRHIIFSILLFVVNFFLQKSFSLSEAAYSRKPFVIKWVSRPTMSPKKILRINHH